MVIGAVVCSKYSNIRYLYLIIGNVQNFVWNHKNGFQEWKSCFLVTVVIASH